MPALSTLPPVPENSSNELEEPSTLSEAGAIDYGPDAAYVDFAQHCMHARVNCSCLQHEAASNMSPDFDDLIIAQNEVFHLVNNNDDASRPWNVPDADWVIPGPWKQSSCFYFSVIDGEFFGEFRSCIVFLGSR